MDLSVLEKTELIVADDLSFKSTADKDYEKLQSWVNTTSYSMLLTLHSCPRRYQLVKARAAGGGSQSMNVDFAYGHTVGAGVQNWLVTGDLDIALFNGFMAWRIPYEASIDKSKKTLWNALLAVMKYPDFHREVLDEWEVLVLPNGKPAIELSFSVDFENGYKHYCHVDVILINKRTKQLAVQENKTTGSKSVEEAYYANSSQALSYAVLLDQLQVDASYEVFYCVYSTTSREWQLLPFTKNNTLRAEWINDVKLDHAAISTYRSIEFFPKRGESCFSFNRRCEFFGECNLTGHLPPMKELPATEEAEPTDFQFTVSQIIQQQKVKNENQ